MTSVCTAGRPTRASNWRGALLALSLTLMAGAAAAEVRVALLPVHRLPVLHTQARALQQLLNEWADAHQDIRAVDPWRCGTVVSQLRGGALTLPRARYYEAFNAIHPIDAWIDMASGDNGATLLVATAKETKRLELTANDLQSLTKALAQCAAFVERALDVASDPSALARLQGFADNAEALAYGLTAIDIPGGAGSDAMETLESAWSVERTGPALASRILDALRQMHLAAGKRKPLYTQRHITMAKAALPRVLDTPYEAAAAALVKANEEWFESDLLSLAKKAEGAELLSVADIMGSDSLPKMAPVATPAASPLGAIRMLGCLSSKKSLNLLVALATANEPDTRLAAVTALLQRQEPEAFKQLQAMAADKDANIALLARYGLWRGVADQAPPPLALARATFQATNILRAVVAEVAGAVADKQDLPMLTTLAASKDNTVRRPALLALLRLAPADPALWRAALADPDSTLQRAALLALPAPLRQGLAPQLESLCNDPQVELADAARAALAPLRPADQWQAIEFDLTTAHPWVRRQLVARLAADASPQALRLLHGACQNRNPRTRAEAMVAMVAREPAAGLEIAAAALSEPHKHLRLQAAASLWQQAQQGKLPMAYAAKVAAALEAEKSLPVKSYLEPTLAKLTNKPYTPAVAARSVAARPSLTWMCGLGSAAPASPYGAYYMTAVRVDDLWRDTYKAGKIFFARIPTVSTPGLAVLDPAWEDRSWSGIEHGFAIDELPYLDGLVFGEETMNFRTAGLWSSGWRLFAQEAGLDAQAIDGDMDKLSPMQKRAWNHWAAERQIDGFNQLYDDTKLLYAMLRPGFQVATFMTEQCLNMGGPNPADLRWKFDVGGIYDYKGSSRTAYYLIRRIKTLWPERPLIWLSLGIGGYDMNPVKYSLKVPTRPMRNRADRAYADSVTAWLAGADIGWFSTWIFVSHSFSGGMANLKGVQIHLEDITPTDKLLEKGIEYAFKDVDKIYAPVKAPKGGTLPPSGGIGGPSGAAKDLLQAFDAEATKKTEQEANERIAAEKQRMKEGFLFYRQYIDTAALIFNTLPRRQYRSSSLGVQSGLSVWSWGATWSEVNALALLPECDFLVDLNKLPAIGTDTYRLIVVGGQHLLTDATIAAITAWLRDKPALLVISPWLSTSDKAIAATATNHQEVLSNAWPWKGDLAITTVEKPATAKEIALSGVSDLQVRQGVVAAHYAGDGIEPLWRHDGKTVAALWRKQGYAGAVIFDGMSNCSSEYLDALRQQINTLAAQGIGQTLPDTAYALLGREGAINGVATAPTGYAASAPPDGVDLISGAIAPTLNKGRDAALSISALDSANIVCHDGITAIAERPLKVIERGAGALVLASAGLLQVTGGEMDILSAGAALPEQTPDAAWLFLQATAGVVRQSWQEGDKTQYRYFVRSAEPLTIRLRR